ncbi:glycoside hydrolase family 36 protein [Streptomyces sp. SID13031]|uniref:glycoside hydrolase family 36 protein n=1 Tax=Streptomyces sp. SID13031 TaxID=2706046 RepID=UPI0013CCE691|nr:glycoside hydrolase family 36 protein [Streptomyces sp. SID13031]NEA36664.1 alpha-galactosidase [Streptomyces sp. SID13031]
MSAAHFEVRSPDTGICRTGTVSAATTVTELPTNEPGVLRYEIIAADLATEPVRIRWTWPVDSAATLWQAIQGTHRTLPTDWGSHRDIRSVRSAPVASFVDLDDTSPCTVSLSSSVRGGDFAIGVNEESAEQLFQLAIDDVEPVDGVHRFTLRIDLRGLHFARALEEVTDTWAAELGDRVTPVPELAYEAMYSTWYSDHQHVSAESVESHARDSAEYGCRAVIVDDGWQTDDTARGYAHCGDWEPTSSTFPDMAEHVRRVHETGLDYVLWIAPPLIGEHSKAWDRFKDHTLGYVDGLTASILDPRYPQVREHIVEACIRPVRDWGVDGLKLDFIDSWAWDGAPPALSPEGDCATVDEGVELVFAAISAELRRLRPSLLIEFRQSYVSPRLWQFGTFLRAGDCALDAVENRVRTVDCRLLAGGRAVHSDMLMWNPGASAEAVAQQFIGVLFSTPQVSVELAQLSPEHERVVRFWLGFMKEHADALLHGVLTPSRPDARYTQVAAASASTKVVAVFANPVVRLSTPSPVTLLVNGSSEPRLYVEGAGARPVQLVVSDCSGVELTRTTTTPPAGLWPIEVPVGGLARVEQI